MDNTLQCRTSSLIERFNIKMAYYVIDCTWEFQDKCLIPKQNLVKIPLT